MNFKNSSNAFIVTVACMLLAAGCDTGEEGEIRVANFVLGTQIATPDSSQNFVAFADQISSPGMLTLEGAIEAGSAGGVFSPGDGTGVFFTAEEGGVLQRWRATPNDSANPTVVRDGTINFAAVGLTSFFPTATHIQFISASKAYLMNSSFGEVIIWNPTDLQVLGRITIPGLVTEINGARGTFSLSGVRTGTQLMFTYNYFANVASFTAESYLVVIDTVTDTVQVDHTTACGDLVYGMKTENGDVYWASSFFNAAFHHLNKGAAPAPCLLRVPSGTATFVDTSVTLTQLAGGRPAANIVSAGGNRALMRVYHEEIVPIAPGTEVSPLVVAPAWRWWLLDLGTLQASELPDSTSGTGQTIYYEVDGASYVITLASDYSKTTFERVVPDAAPVPGLTVTGAARFGLVRVF